MFIYFLKLKLSNSESLNKRNHYQFSASQNPFSNSHDKDNFEVVSFHKNFSPASKDSEFSNTIQFNSNGRYGEYNYTKDTESSLRKKKKQIKHIYFGTKKNYRVVNEPSSPQKSLSIGLNSDSLKKMKKQIISSKDHSLSGDKRKNNPKLKFDVNKMVFNKPENKAKNQYSINKGISIIISQ
jgi:hypothetical protein